MKRLLLPFFVLALAGCGDANTQGPPDEIGSGAPNTPDDVVFTAKELGALETAPDTNLSPEEQLNLTSCREMNADISLQIEGLKKQNELLQADLTAQQEKTNTGGLRPEHKILLRNALMATKQKAFPFDKCGKINTFLKTSWYKDFSDKLFQERIRFSNGFLEASDFFGGCQSTTGKMVYFVGAERGEDAQFYLVKYNTAQKAIEPVLILDDADTAAVTTLGKRDGPFIRLPADDGRVLRYYYDSNILIVEE